MSKDWVKDIHKMQSKYGVHDWMEKATEEQKAEYCLLYTSDAADE